MKGCAVFAAAVLCAATGSAQTFEFDPALDLSSYKKTALDVCDINAAFRAEDYETVDKIYSEGKNAIRSDGRKRIPQGVIVRAYPDEKWYQVFQAFYSAPRIIADWTETAVYGTAPNEEAALRTAAGASWMRIYQLVYVLHEMDAAFAGAKAGEWDSSYVETNDAYAVYTGEGPCSFKDFITSTSPANAPKITNAFIAMKDAADAARQPTATARAKAASLVTFSRNRDKAFNAFMGAMLRATRNAASVSSTSINSSPLLVKKAEAYPLFQFLEPFVSNEKSQAKVDSAFAILDYACPRARSGDRCATNADPKQLRKDIIAIAAANNLAL